MTLGEPRIPGGTRAQVAVTHGDAPVVLLADSEQVISRVIALRLVARTPAAAFDEYRLAQIRSALLAEEWVEAVVAWMDATGQVVDVYPDEPVWTENEFNAERVALELRMAPIFED